MIHGATVRANEHNVISAIVVTRVGGADSAKIRFVPAAPESPTGLRDTPAVSIVGDSAVLPVLGLQPLTRYLMRVIVYGAGGSATGPEMEFTTGTLPVELRAYEAEGTDPRAGFVVFGAGEYGVVIDNAGRIVWYRRFPDNQILNFMVSGTGGYLARPATAHAGDIEPWFELDPLGNVRSSFGCALGLRPRLHDAISDGTGGHWLMCDETRTLDLTAFGGFADARVTGTVVQHVAADGRLLFHWSPFNHFALGDAHPDTLTRATVNWTHGNAIDFAPDGNLIVSFRNLGEITKIDGTTGAVVWRLGGARNQFTFVGTGVLPFSGQHSARMPTADALVLFDNVGNSAASRGERYQLNESAMTATLVRSFGSTPDVVTMIGGSVQHLPEGRLLVSFGTAGRVEEYDAEGRVVWRIKGNSGYVFRATRIRSLYAPGKGLPR